MGEKNFKYFFFVFHGKSLKVKKKREIVFFFTKTNNKGFKHQLKKKELKYRNCVRMLSNLLQPNQVDVGIVTKNVGMKV